MFALFIALAPGGGKTGAPRGTVDALNRKNCHPEVPAPFRRAEGPQL